MPKAQVMKWGNSLAVRIPKGIAEEARMREGDAVLITAAKNRIELHRAESIPTLKEFVAKFHPDNRHEEIEWGSDVGKEIVEW
jgi:antitoxin MazE